MSFWMKVLVTGGAGFIGSQLALRLEKESHTVTVIDNFFSAASENLKGLRGKVLQSDLSEISHFDETYDAVFHQASLTDPRYPNDEEMYQKNVVGFEKVLKLCVKQNAKLIFASTAGLYGNGPVPMKEDQTTECITAYGRSKLKMEEMALKQIGNIHCIGLRYFNVFGPHEAHKGRPASMIYHLWRQMKDGNRPRLFKWGEQVRDFIYVKDAVEANLLALNGTPGIYNVGTGVATSFNLLVTCLNEVLGTHFEPEYFDMPFEGATYQHNTLADTEHAQKGLGFKSRWTLPEAIKDYISFLETNEEDSHA